MNLLVVTQTVDTEDPALGFFVRWIEGLAKRFEHIEVICLREGKYALPQNVRVHSLGKEKGNRSRSAYALSFLTLAWRLRRDYDAVFVHMNQEYVLIAGWLWSLLRKPVYMWRNHYAGSVMTDIAAAWCRKVFCTSKHSYTAKYKKTVSMPVGVDTERFFPDPHVARKPKSILFLARMAPSKRPDMLVDALALLHGEGIDFSATFVGSPLPQDESYYASLKQKAHMLGLGGRISFIPAVPNAQTPDLYRAHEIFVNCSPSGMLDKTIFEAAACGCHVLAASDDFAEVMPKFHFNSAVELTERIRTTLATPSSVETAELIAGNSLGALVERLVPVLSVKDDHRPWALIVIALVLAFTPFHFVGLGYGLPLALAGDEFVHVAMAFTMLAEHTLRATFPFAYVPPLMAYLCLPFYILFILGALPFLGSLGAVQAFVLAHENYFLIAPRLISGLFFIALLFVLFHLARSLFGRTAAYLALLFVALDFQVFHESILGHFWLPETVFIVAAFLALVKMRETGERRWYISAALAAGFGYGIGYLSLLAVPFAPFFYFGAPKRSPRLAFLSCGIFTALAAMFSWLNPVSFVRQFGRALNVGSAALSLPLSLPVPVSSAPADVLANIQAFLAVAMRDNPVLLILAACGAFLLARHHRYAALAVVFVFPIVYLCVGSVMWSGPDHRYILPLIPPIILAGVYALMELWNQGGVARNAAVLFAAAALLYSGVGTVSYARLMAIPDTRLAARAWLAAHAGNSPAQVDVMYFDDAKAHTPSPEWYVYGRYENKPAPPAGFTLVTAFGNASRCRPSEDLVGDASYPLEALALTNLGPCIEIYRRTP